MIHFAGRLIYIRFGYTMTHLEFRFPPQGDCGREIAQTKEEQP